MMHDPKSLAAKQAHEFAVLTRLVPEGMTAEMRAAARTRHHREIIAATLAVRFPGLASEVCALVSADEGALALDRISDAIATLHDEDPILFKAIPTREEMLRLAIDVIHGGRATEQDRRSLWPSFCDRSDENRLRDGYKFRHEIAARGAAKPSPKSPEVLSDAHDAPRNGLIDGGPGARARVASALDATAFEEVESDALARANATFSESEEDAAHIDEGANA